MGTARRWNAIALVLLSSALVAGCASPASPDAPDPAPAAPAPATPTPTSPPRLPALEDLVITPGGIGSLRVGQPVSGTDMIVFDPEYCEQMEGDSGFHGDGTPVDYGRWVPNYPGETPLEYPFNAHVNEGDVVVIEVRNDTLSTAEGVGIGSSLQSLTAAYPSLDSALEGPMSKLLVLATAEGDLVFEVSTESDSYPPDVVIDIRIYPAGKHELKLVAATDDIVGGCL